MKAWRLGRKKKPCDFVPRDLCSWQNRFDDPERKYRTIYCAEQRITCLREVLADLRPNARAIEDFTRLFGTPAENGLTVAGVVSTKWRRAHVLALGDVRLSQGILTCLYDTRVLQQLSKKHAKLLAQHGLKQLDQTAIRSKNRNVTQPISRSLFDAGNAGVKFLSHLDGKPCFALFEGRATLVSCSTPTPMTEDVEELIRVCGEFTLVLRPV